MKISLGTSIRRENIPMTAGDIVVVATGPYALGDVGPDGFNSGESLESRHDEQKKLWKIGGAEEIRLD